jgi:hypothetical protein
MWFLARLTIDAFRAVLFRITIRAVTAATFTTIPAFQQELRGEDHQPILEVIVFTFFKRWKRRFP